VVGVTGDIEASGGALGDCGVGVTDCDEFGTLTGQQPRDVVFESLFAQADDSDA
jgi:hypothetical protein